MISCFIGKDRDSARREGKAAFEAACTANPLSPIFRFEGDPVQLESLPEAIRSGGLFGTPAIVLLDEISGVGEGDEGREVLNGAILSASTTDAQVFILEDALLAESKKLVEKVGGKIRVIDGKPTKTRAQHEPWGIIDAFAERDRKKAWVEFQEAVRAGLEAEGIHGVLFWGVKMLAIVEKAESDGEAIASGVNPNMLRTWKGRLQNFKKGEALDLLGELKDMSYQGHVGGDLMERIERFILER